MRQTRDLIIDPNCNKAVKLDTTLSVLEPFGLGKTLLIALYQGCIVGRPTDQTYWEVLKKATDEDIAVFVQCRLNPGKSISTQLGQVRYDP